MLEEDANSDLCSENEGGSAHLIDATAAVAAVNAVVALLAPISPPRVFDRPERRGPKDAIVYAIANDEHAVIEARREMDKEMSKGNG